VFRRNAGTLRGRLLVNAEEGDKAKRKYLISEPLGTAQSWSREKRSLHSDKELYLQKISKPRGGKSASLKTSNGAQFRTEGRRGFNWSKIHLAMERRRWTFYQGRVSNDPLKLNKMRRRVG